MRGEITWSDHAQEMLDEKRSEIGAERVEDAVRRPQQDFPADDTRRPGRRMHTR